jgi:tRNA pseudouridine38-40 synthase
VRIIVGTLLEIGRGKRRAADLAEILASRDRRAAGKTALPHGLCLVSVEYGADAGRGDDLSTRRTHVT